MKTKLLAFAALAVFFAGCSDQFFAPKSLFYTEPPKPAYTVKMDTAEGGTIAVNPAKDSYDLNEQIKLTATPITGYIFKGWTGTINRNENPLLLTVTENIWIIPHFEPQTTYSLMTEWNPVGGSIISSAGTKTTFMPGEKCFIIATPAAGYEFYGWKGDIETTGDTVYITFNKDYQIFPRFTKIPETITYTLTTSSPNGTIQCSPEKPVYYANEIVRVTAKPDSGYIFSSWDAEYTGETAVFDIVMNENKSISASFIKRQWTFVVYMAADNDLEPAAIDDFKELEAVPLAGNPVSILVLFDRAVGYDATNGDWTDTRLFEITPDNTGNNALIISKRLDCPDLGLSSSINTELDMSQTLVLSRLITFAQREYSADNYGLIMWGHGTGWRSDGAVSGSVEPLKAMAFDGSAGHYMSLADFGSAVSEKNLSIIGFDTCFAALLEVAYQVKNSGAQYLVGSAGIVPAAGWDYQTTFSTFLTKSTLTAATFSEAVIFSYANQYSGMTGATISRIDLSEVDKLFTAFDTFASALAQSITTRASRDTVLAALLNTEDSYYFSPPSDLYIDIQSFANAMIALKTKITTNSAQQNKISITSEALLSAISPNGAVTATWSKQHGRDVRRHIGVYLIGLTALGVVKTPHPESYTKGSPAMDKSAFVENSSHWVPNMVPQETSLLDKLFYWPF
jgi:hypothetical protein